MKCQTLQESIEKYLERGFGSMNKNDFEVFIFDYLLQNELEGLSDNAISRKLQIPESKVNWLRYEAELKYPHDENYYKEKFYKILQERVYKTVDNNRIQFSITDKALRLYLDDMLESHGSYADSSFNSNIVTLTASDLMLLISVFEGKKDDIVKRINESRKKSDADFQKDTKKSQLFLELGAAILKDVGSHFSPNVTEFLSSYLENLKNKQ